MKYKKMRTRSPAKAAGVFFVSFFLILAGILGTNHTETDTLTTGSTGTEVMSAIVGPTEVQAAGTAGLVLEFNDDGTLVITTYGKKATSGIRYDTVGWTIKRYNAPIGSGNITTRVKYDYAWNEADLQHPGYEYGHFVVSSSTIYSRIRSASEEWAETLYQNGGVVYLDAIITIEEYGKAKGGMNADGVTWGEVYFDYNGISKARAWARPQDLKNFFNHGVSFPAINYKEDSEESTATVKGRNPEELSDAGTYRVTSATGQFDVTQGIPSSESVQITAALPAYSLFATITNHKGTRLEKTGKLDYAGKPVYKMVSYNYDTLDELWGYELVGAGYRESGILGGAGILAGGNGDAAIWTAAQRIMVSSGNWETLVRSANSTAGNISYGTIAQILPETANGNYEIFWNTSYRKVVFVSGGAQSTQYGSTTEVASERLSTPRSASVYVHTPVVDRLVVSDEKIWNQQVTPTDRTSLVLGRTFTVEPAVTGTHRNIPGYGIRDYAAYAGSREIRFPFAVAVAVDSWTGMAEPVDNIGSRSTFCGKEYLRIEADTWITVTGKTEFFLPEDVDEGDYIVESRVIAINAQTVDGSFEENGANLSPEHTIAVDTERINVSGRIFGLTVTDILDYPRWQQVFQSGLVYRSGIRDENGILENIASGNQRYTLPISIGSHPILSELKGVGLGYRVIFSFETVGNYDGEAKDGDGIVIIPAFYWVDSNLENCTRVDLYYRKDEKLVRIGSGEDLAYCPETGAAEPYSYGKVCLTEISRTIPAEGRQRWTGEYSLPGEVYAVSYGTDLNAYAQRKKGFLKFDDDVFLKDGYIIVRMELCAISEGEPKLLYGNARNAANGYCSMWTTEGYQTDRNYPDGSKVEFQLGDIVVFDRKQSRNADYNVMGTE